jgi:tetratricopeptide (TPR) repeat protein
MKSERRHELQKNELAQALDRGLETLRPYTGILLAGALVLAVGMMLTSWWRQASSESSATAWDDLFGSLNTGNPSELDKVAEKNAGSEVGMWASVLAGDLHLTQGCEELFHNKAMAAQELRKAEDAYLKVRDQGRSSMLRERALFGLARTYEALGGLQQSDNAMEKAIGSYEQLLKDWPKGTFASVAKERLESLKTPAAKSFYDRFARYDPLPTFSTPATGSGKPAFDPSTLKEDDASEKDKSGLSELHQGLPLGEKKADATPEPPVDATKTAPVGK